MFNERENRCVQSGCPGYCCENMTLYDTEEVILHTFPNAKEVSTWEMQKIINDKREEGVFYLYDGRSPADGMVIARISGPCVNRKNNGSCGRYQRCSHAAENFKFGSKDCNDLRIAHGLPRVKP